MALDVALRSLAAEAVPPDLKRDEAEGAWRPNRPTGLAGGLQRFTVLI